MTHVGIYDSGSVMCDSGFEIYNNEFWICMKYVIMEMYEIYTADLEHMAVNLQYVIMDLKYMAINQEYDNICNIW